MVGYMAPCTTFRLLLLVLMFGRLVSTSGDIFTAMSKLRQSLKYVKQNQLEKQLRDVINKDKNKKNEFKIKSFEKNIKGYITTYKDISEESLAPGFKLHHPLNAYRFVRNQSVVFTELTTKFLSKINFPGKINESLWTAVREVSKHYPGPEDLEGIIYNILNLQSRYNLSVDDMAAGIIAGYASRKLTARECLDIAIGGYTHSYYFYGKLWMQYTLKMVQGDQEQAITQVEVLKEATQVARKSGSLMEAVKYATDLRSTGWNRKEAEELLQSCKDAFAKFNETATNQQKMRQRMLFQGFQPRLTEYQSLTNIACQGKQKVNTNESFVCWQTDNNHPLLVLQPIKVEEISREPFIVVIHDVISKGALKKYRSHAEGKLIPSKISGQKINAEVRSSQSYSITIASLPELKQRIEAVTALSLQTAEVFQIANYGAAGYYKRHLDSWDPVKNPNNRFATFMLYLTDVEAGGATSFTEIHKSVFPKAGTAIFWYNIRPDGERDSNTWHEACPVLVGDKWIFTSWIDIYGQMFVRPCRDKPADTCPEYHDTAGACKF